MRVEVSEIVRQADQFSNQMIQALGLDLHVRVEEPKDHEIRVWLHGRDAPLVLSNNARLLYAFNHLLNQAFYGRSAERINFVVDCNDYRATRVLELELLARKAAEKACGAGLSVSLQPMPANERRIIHLALADAAGVQTQSEGQGFRRRVIISPS